MTCLLFIAVIDGSNPKTHIVTQAKDLLKFVQGDILDLRITSTADYEPAGIGEPVRAGLEIEF